jgi:hypothetical protein
VFDLIFLAGDTCIFPAAVVIRETRAATMTIHAGNTTMSN